MRTITCFGDRTKQHFPCNCLRLLDEDNSVSWTDNFVNVKVFNSVTFSSCTLLPLRFALFLNNTNGL